MPSPITIFRAPSVAEQVYQQLTRAIVSHDIPPGAPIVIEQLASLVGVSRTPIREVLPLLVADGLLEETARGLLRVVPITREHVRHVFQARAGLEGMATFLATPHIPDDELSRMQARLRGLEPDIAAGVFEDYFKADSQLHALVVTHCGNPYLARLLQGLHNHVERVRAVSQQRAGQHLLASQAEHLALLDTLVARDARRAKALAEAHVLQGGERIAALVPEEAPAPGTLTSDGALPAQTGLQ